MDLPKLLPQVITARANLPKGHQFFTLLANVNHAVACAI
jgi:hypothetical protein